MMRRLISLSFLLVMTLVGCYPPSTVMVNPEYAGKNLTVRKLQILPIPLDAISIKNPDDVQDDFSDDKRPPDVIIQDSLYRIMREECHKRIQNVILAEPCLPYSFFSSQTDRNNFDIVTLTSGKEKMIKQNFFVPKRSVFADSSTIPYIALILNSVIFGRNINTTTGIDNLANTASTPVGNFTTPRISSRGGSTITLRAIVTFVIWDYGKNSDVAYGTVDEEEVLFLAMTQSTWKSLFKKLASEIFKDTPFKLKYIDRGW